MPYYPTIEEDLMQAKALLKRGAVDHGEMFHGPSELGGTIYGADTHAAWMLLNSFVAELTRLRDPKAGVWSAKYLNPECAGHGCQWLKLEAAAHDQKMLATVIRNTVLALADVPDDWEGSVDEGVTLINANIATALDQLENYQLLLALLGVTDYKAAVRAWKATQDHIKEDRIEREIVVKQILDLQKRAEDAERLVERLYTTELNCPHCGQRSAIGRSALGADSNDR